MHESPTAIDVTNLLTVAIATAAIYQAIFAGRLSKLQQQIEDARKATAVYDPFLEREDILAAIEYAALQIDHVVLQSA